MAQNERNQSKRASRRTPAQHVCVRVRESHTAYACMTHSWAATQAPPVQRFQCGSNNPQPGGSAGREGSSSQIHVHQLILRSSPAAGVRGACGAMALCPEACVSGSAPGEPPGSEVSPSFQSLAAGKRNALGLLWLELSLPSPR